MKFIGSISLQGPIPVKGVVMTVVFRQRLSVLLPLALFFLCTMPPLLDYSVGSPTGEVRKSAVSGTWYPATKQEILKAIDAFKKGVSHDDVAHRPPGIRPILLIAPHAGWRFSGKVAYEAFSRLAPFRGRIKKVFLIAPAHRVGFKGVSCPDFTAYETPLGRVSVDQSISYKLRQLPFVGAHREAHKFEHSIEIELPFLQYFLGDFRLVSILISWTDREMLDSLGRRISELLDSRSIIVVSSDFTHYGPQYGYMPFGPVKDGRRIEGLDMEAFSFIKGLDPEGLWHYVKERHMTICGRWAIVAGLYAIGYKYPKDCLKVGLIAYDQSGRILGDYTNSVSYAAAEIDFIDRTKYLPGLARRTIQAAFGLGPWPRIDEVGDAPYFKRKSGCFVTLETEEGALRGCIGHIEPILPLWQCVKENTLGAAFRDPRFRPLKKDELGAIHIEVSILTPLRPLAFNTPEELLRRIRPGVHGIVLKRGRREATFLPQVWEKLKRKEDFLSMLCMKAGMRQGCWRTPDIQVFTYEVKRYGEGGLGIESEEVQ